MNVIDSSFLFFISFIILTVGLAVIADELRKIRELLEG